MICTHERHPIPRPRGRDVRCLVIRRKMTAINRESTVNWLPLSWLVVSPVSSGHDTEWFRMTGHLLSIPNDPNYFCHLSDVRCVKIKRVFSQSSRIFWVYISNRIFVCVLNQIPKYATYLFIMSYNVSKSASGKYLQTKIPLPAKAWASIVIVDQPGVWWICLYIRDETWVVSR